MQGMLGPFFVVALLAVSCPAAAQQVKTFELGALRDDVFTAFGVPERYFAPEPDRYLYGIEEYVAASRVWTRIDDVFMRETPTNLYEVHVQYHFDSRQSRLRPKQRVGRIKFIVDQPVNYQETLDELPEAKSICKDGCSVYGWYDRYGVYGDKYYVLAYPANPSAELLSLGKQVAVGFDERDTTETYSIGIFLKFVNRVSASALRPPDPNQINWYAKIREIEISPICPQCQLELARDSRLFGGFNRRSRRSRQKWPVELGTWQLR